MHLVDSGALQADDLVWHAGLSGWTRADQIPGLLFGRPLAPPAHCGQEPQHNLAETQKHGWGFKNCFLKILSAIRITPKFHLNWVGIAFALLIILAALVFKLFGY